MTFRKPPPLKPGDAVRVVAPAGPIPKDALEPGLRVLGARYRASFDDGLFSKNRYLAGSDERRRVELEAALRDPSSRATFCARGGYGTMRLLPSLKLDGAPVRPFIGFSDITALHLALNAQGWVTFHGPVVTQLGKHSTAVADRLFNLLESSEPAPPLQGERCLVDGIAEGPLLGGNFSVLTRLIGTPFLPDLTGAVLLLEDIDERPYRIDRMWTHLALSGIFQKIRGIVLGDFTGCDEKDAWTSAEVLADLARQTGLPCADGFRIGHGDVHLAVPLGVRVRLDAKKGELQFLEAAVDARTRA